MDVVFELLGYALSGWWFLLSPRYRHRTRLRWARQRSMATAQEIVGATAGNLVLISIPLLWWLS